MAFVGEPSYLMGSYYAWEVHWCPTTMDLSQFCVSKHLNRYCKISVDNGTNTLFWRENWLETEGPLYLAATAPIPAEIMDITLADLFQFGFGTHEYLG